jgi:5'-deoxynucleotidase YfbR-like HD superfamily hydrolase
VVADHPSSPPPMTHLEFDFNKVIQIALIHDVAECIIGDITPEDNISKKDKHQLEYNAMLQITQLLHSATTYESSYVIPVSQLQEHQFMKLFHEYEERQSIESIIVKDLDLLDMILQANTYEQQYMSSSSSSTDKTKMDLSDFFVGTPPSRFQIPQIRQIAEELHHQRNERIKNNNWRSTNTSTTIESMMEKTPPPTNVSSTNTQNNTDSTNDDMMNSSCTNDSIISSLSKSDLQFVAEYTKTVPSLLQQQSPQASIIGNSGGETSSSIPEMDPHCNVVLATVLALRQWEAKHSPQL